MTTKETVEKYFKAMYEDLRRHIEVDIKGIAEEWGQGLYVVESGGGRVVVFDGRM